MQTASFQEAHSSHIPALHTLMNMGYTYISPEAALQERGGRNSRVLLEGILRRQLHKINRIRVSSTRTSTFTEQNIEAGIRALQDIPLVSGYIAATQTAYELITLGKTLEQSIAGDKKGFTLHYIDWQYPQNNVFHVTEEYSVLRSGRKDHYRPDIVLFVNGIPLSIIECKRPDIKDPVKQAISQHDRNQQEDGIRPLYIYAQVLLAIASNDARYATNGTPMKYWASWKEKFITREDADTYETNLQALRSKPIPQDVQQNMFSEHQGNLSRYVESMKQQPLQVTEQDRYLYSLCHPQRLMDLSYNFILYDNGEKKIARYQQYYAVKKTIRQISGIHGGKRKGGVVWHTQGSGKSLTMVMLAQAIGQEPGINNPKIILVTDRTDLDTQIKGTFEKCGLEVHRAKTGQQLVERLESKSEEVITTVINKFQTAVKKIKQPLTSPDIFVLVDEGHRTQHGMFNIDMQKTLPNACYIAFTGTPLFKKDKSTLAKFGSLIDTYTVDQAVKDGAVVPLLYEGRHAPQKTHASQVDNYFSLIAEPLNEQQKADLKRKYSRADQLNVAEQKIMANCWDIVLHYQKNFQGTDFKGQLVCPSKDSAVRYKEFLDSIDRVSAEVMISPPDDREGEETPYGETTDRVKRFWKKMMDEHGNAPDYQRNIIQRFKNTEHPEIIIVVDKLLTGFDAPRNAVLYLTRKLRNHTLLQAVARVNRVYPGKDYGLIIDYYGILGELDDAMETYSALDEFDAEDLEGTLTDIRKEIAQLPQAHSDLWDIFKTIPNKKDAEACEQLLRDEEIRHQFYEKLTNYARILKLALSSIDFHNNTSEDKQKRYKDDLKFFISLRRSVMQRYSDRVDYKQYEGQIQKLLDTHVQSEEVRPITGLVDIFDKDAFRKEVEQTQGKAAKADKIASRTARHINEHMDEDPAFYKKFSELLNDAIRAYEEGRINEAEYLKRVNNASDKVVNHTDDQLPDALKNRPVAGAFFGTLKEEMEQCINDADTLKSITTEAAQQVDAIINNLLVVDWQSDPDIPQQMQLKVGDYLTDEVRDKYDLELSLDDIDRISEKLVDIAQNRYRNG